MATINLTSVYANLDRWPGDLLRADEDTVVTARTATTFRFTLGSTSEFAGYTVVVGGTGFTYLNGVATSGTMSSVRIVGPGGATVANITGLTGPIATDFDQFISDVFGSPTGDTGPGPDGEAAWDVLSSGSDLMNGTAGDDWLFVAGFNTGNDTANGFGGDDQMFGSIGNDIYNGGAGYDTLSFYETSYGLGGAATRGIIVNVRARTVIDSWGGTDRFTSVEGFEGSRFNDVFNGSAATDDAFSGLRGNDTFRGGQVSVNSTGQFTSDDDDFLSYNSDYWNGGSLGIRVNLETSFVNGSIRGSIRDGFGNIDTVIDIEQVEGTRFGDSFIGSRAGNVFWGGEGQDTYNGRGGFDILEFDRWFGDNDPVGVVVDLSLATGQIINDGFGNTETALSIEEVDGTDGTDVLRSGAGGTLLEGRDGADILTGRGGRDTFIWNDMSETGDGDRVTDFVATGPSADWLAFEIEGFVGMTDTLRLVNGTNATTNQGTFLFNAATDTLVWDSNGTGAGGRTVVAILTNVASLSAANFQLWD